MSQMQGFYSHPLLALAGIFYIMCISPSIPNDVAALTFKDFIYQPEIDDLVQDCSNSIANALELLHSCTKPLKCGGEMHSTKKQTRVLPFTEHLVNLILIVSVEEPYKLNKIFALSVQKKLGINS